MLIGEEKKEKKERGSPFIKETWVVNGQYRTQVYDRRWQTPKRDENGALKPWRGQEGESLNYCSINGRFAHFIYRNWWKIWARPIYGKLYRSKVRADQGTYRIK